MRGHTITHRSVHCHCEERCPAGGLSKAHTHVQWCLRLHIRCMASVNARHACDAPCQLPRLQPEQLNLSAVVDEFKRGQSDARQSSCESCQDQERAAREASRRCLATTTSIPLTPEVLQLNTGPTVCTHRCKSGVLRGLSCAPAEQQDVRKPPDHLTVDSSTRSRPSRPSSTQTWHPNMAAWLIRPSSTQTWQA